MRRMHLQLKSGAVLALACALSLGATAALAVLGKPTPIAANRGRALQLPDQAQAVVTYHPSFLLRVPDEKAKAEAFDAFVDDLKLAWSLAA